MEVVVDKFFGLGRLRPGYDPTKGVRARGIVSIGEPPIDKIATITFVQNRSTDPCERIVFWRKKEHPSPEVVDEWRDKGLVPIDIGGEKYNTLEGVGSAFEQTAGVYSLDLTPAETCLCNLLAKNNATGCLKGGRWKIPWILREAYKLGVGETEVVRRVTHVVNTWITSYDAAWTAETEEVVQKIAGPFPAIREDGVGDNFSLHQYAFLMALVGTSIEEGQERLRWFYKITKRARGLKCAAKKLWEEKRVPGLHTVRREDGLVVGFLKTDNPYLSRENVLPVLVCKNSHGHVAILTNHRCRISLRATATVLRKALGDEEKHLFYDERIEAILFGTRQYSDTPPFPLGEGRVKRIILENVPRRLR